MDSNRVLQQNCPGWCRDEETATLSRQGIFCVPMITRRTPILPYGGKLRRPKLRRPELTRHIREPREFPQEGNPGATVSKGGYLLGFAGFPKANSFCGVFRHLQRSTNSMLTELRWLEISKSSCSQCTTHLVCFWKKPLHLGPILDELHFFKVPASDRVCSQSGEPPSFSIKVKVSYLKRF